MVFTIKYCWLLVSALVSLALWKNMSSSVGMMKFITKWKNKKMFQTTNQHEY
jgi:hypothetical protein